MEHGAVAAATAPAAGQARQQQQQQQQRHHQGPLEEAEADVLHPKLFGKAVEYYFYPNSMVPVFCPTEEQFADFEALVGAMEPLAQRAGVCKIIPPRKWRRELEQRNQQEAGAVRVFDEEEFPIMRPIVQHFNGSSGIFHQYNVEFHRRLRLAQFFQISQDASHRQPDYKVAAIETAEKGNRSGGSGAKESESTVAASGDAAESAGIDDADDAARVVESETVGIAVNYDAGEVRLTSAAADALRQGIRSEGQRARFRPAVSRYRPQPDTQGEAAADHMGVRQVRRFADDGRPLFVTEREYAANEELERIYWKNMLFQPPMYGADVLGTLFPPYDEFPTWNIRNLPGLLRQIGQRMPGVNDPYLYLGMWKATFAWHVEDMDLYSINYIHFGEPKSWYAIPIAARSRFEMSMQNVFANDYKSCSQFLRHKSFLLSPRFLASQGIPFNRIVQRAGEIVLTFPLGYHAGFNHGFNCAESVNFALDRWLDVAWDSRHCECVKDSVTIDLMEWFGDARKARQQQARQRGESPGAAAGKHTAPRRHAAAAVATTSAPSAVGELPGKSAQARKPAPPRKAAGGPAAAAGAKRRPSGAPRPEPGAKRLPRKRSHKEVAADSAEDSSSDSVAEEQCDVQRRLASLRTPSGACGACLEPIGGCDTQEEMPEEADIVECQQCGLTVHEQCSALAYDDGSYKCANCEMDTDQLSCALCAFQNGLLLPLKGRGADQPAAFAHFLCANFIGETYFDFPAAAPEAGGDGSAGGSGRMGTRSHTARQRGAGSSDSSGPMAGSAKVCGADGISKTRFAARCIYCADDSGQAHGPVVQCAHSKCFRSFHPMCAAVHDITLLDWSRCAVYCPTHGCSD
ncbi:hypothetical protein LPJ61_002900 [Coemansia biformis]|uniref:[Histone H3]-trimethyl-L-lysine(9) demethylase n=1 Tax=Coemansia biformis TaxID=1286918 RepID=A0A9W7YCF3_9FUNG|nr:hypothetical protein LPJ61_002900 [Coemansia biformis]